MSIRHTPNREEQALIEVGHTTVSTGIARLLTVLLLLTVVSVPALQSLAEWRGATAQQPPSRLAPQLRDLVGKLPGVAQLLAERGLLAANRALLAAIDDFEDRLEEESILRSWLLPRVQTRMVAWLGQGNEQAYVGRDGWLFYRPDVDYVIGPGFLESDVLQRRAQSGKAWEEAPQPDPLAALVDFARQLQGRDIRLLVVPTPAKPMIHPERFAPRFDGAATTLQNSSFPSFRERLEQAGIVLVELASLERQAEDDEPRFLRTDTHWTPAAMERAAAELTESIRQALPGSDRPRQDYLRRRATVENLGDIATMLRLPPGQRLFAPERVETSAVLTLEGRSWKPDRHAELLLLGDSFTNVYSDPGLGWGATAGLAEQLSFHLRQPLDRIALNAGGSHATRLALARELAAGNDRLQGKKLVIYQFAARELASATGSSSTSGGANRYDPRLEPGLSSSLAPLLSRPKMSLLRLAAGLLVSSLFLACAPQAGSVFPPESNILLVTVDTLRADHLSSYGYPRRTSPVMDRLAAEGVRFDQTAVQWPKTGPSFASIFTATYPKDNGIVRKIGIPLPQEFRMLAEVLQRRGYGTHAVVSNGAVAREFNFDQGFDTYLETWKPNANKSSVPKNDAAEVNELVRAVVSTMDRSRPFFLWVHYLDPHFPYVPPADWQDRFQGDDQYDPSRKIAITQERRNRQLGGISILQQLSGQDEHDFYVARYDAEIAYTDHELGELLDFLRQEGLLDKTLTVVTSDHGESLGEHNYFFDHGRFSFQTCLRVPLIFHYPGALEPRVDDRPVELIDLAPTLLEAAGVDLEDGLWMQGRSLTPRLLGLDEPEGEAAPFYSHSEAGYATKKRWQKIVRDERYKLIYAPYESDQRWIGGRKGAYFALFDLVEDPAETTNLADREPEIIQRLSDELKRWWKPDQIDVMVDEPVRDETREMDEATRRQLKALGYLQ